MQEVDLALDTPRTTSVCVPGAAGRQQSDQDLVLECHDGSDGAHSDQDQRESAVWEELEAVREERDDAVRIRDLALGLMKTSMLEMKGVTAKMAMMKTGSSYIELLQFDTPAGNPPGPGWTLADHGINHLCLMVDDVDAEYARLSAAGMQFHAPPVHNTGRPTVACYGRDPDGNRIELIQVTDVSVPFHYANHRLERLKELAER